MTVTGLMNVAQGMCQVEGRYVKFLVCVIRALGSWVSFNCHPTLPILPKNEESYWFPSGHTIYFLVLTSRMCIFSLCHCCVQAKAAFICRFQVGVQLNMWIELQGVNCKTALLTTLPVHNVLSALENLHVSRSSDKTSHCCSVQLLPNNKTGTERSCLSLVSKSKALFILWCVFVYKCGVTEQRTRQKKWILHFTLKTLMPIVNMSPFVGDFQISWAECHIFALSLTVSLFQGSTAGAGRDLETETWENSYAGTKCSNLTWKKNKGNVTGKVWERSRS